MTDDPAWPQVQEWIRAAQLAVEILPPNTERREVVFREVGVSLASSLGAVICETSNGLEEAVGST